MITAYPQTARDADLPSPFTVCDPDEDALTASDVIANAACYGVWLINLYTLCQFIYCRLVIVIFVR